MTWHPCSVLFHRNCGTRRRKNIRISNRGLPLKREFAHSIESLLRYYGEAAITESRYFWELQEYRPESASIMFSRWTLHTLIYALFITLHDYPERIYECGPRFDTRFIPFEPPDG